MKKDKILLFLFIGLSVAVVVLYFYTKNKNAKKAGEKFPLVPGATGKAVAMVQAALGIRITGVFDAVTIAAMGQTWRTDTVTGSEFMDHIDYEPEAMKHFPMLVGDQNFEVGMVQILLGVKLTGTMDSNTVKALKTATGSTTITLSGYRDLIFNTLGV